MSYAALDNIDDAIDATKRFLLPFDLATWLRLAVVMFFVAGGGGGAASYAQNAPQFADGFGDSGGGPGGGLDGVSGGEIVSGLPDASVGVAIVVLLALVLLVALALFFLSPIMEFVFVQSLFEEQVHVRRYFSQNVGNGLRLLAFQLVITLVGLVLFGGLFLLVVLLLGSGTDLGAAAAGLFVFAIPLFFLYAIVAGTIQGFTRVFVVPIMLAEDRGLLSAWGRLWNALTGNIGEFLVYLVVSVVLGIGIGIVGSFASLFALLIIGIPLGAVAFGVFAIAGGGVVSIAAIAVLGLLFLALFLLVVNLVQAPLQSFLRYYAMLVLGAIDPDLDPIPEIRASVES
ncbi:hypothetical protein BRC91_04855 [Halobacteriales archaeon QS_4_62_28]|nr:MAG: hypothetical protein BRC91_04855 [Halobacteriales archaeon QS_4_62_28]